MSPLRGATDQGRMMKLDESDRGGDCIAVHVACRVVRSNRKTLLADDVTRIRGAREIEQRHAASSQPHDDRPRNGSTTPMSGKEAAVHAHHSSRGDREKLLREKVRPA